MNISTRSVELLKTHLHLLSSDKQPLARYVSDNWPLSARLPQGVAARAELVYRFRVDSLAAAERVARELFLEVAGLARQHMRHEA
ncbi:hypothetical protein CNR27_04460 [Luteimonas chenhongjianii]|uniref:Uncharacterized protein n=1 Tax=Luteimonas chenhongjianii TaxID=2006110 RepID=A0A290XCH1_9GAMM|nr:hypothetical protein CNR27_04460 [Luteimonas chenhongjianii]